MSRHDESVEPRQRLSTQKRADNLRVLIAPLARDHELGRGRAFATMRAVTGSNLARLANLPGLPSESRLSHLRNDEDGALHFLDALIRAKVAIGDPVESCGLIPLHLWETIETALDTNRVPLTQAMLTDQHYDSDQDVAAAEAWASGFSTVKLERLAGRLRVELASKRTLLTAVNLELDRRAEAAA